jgi:hypothetical protein
MTGCSSCTHKKVLAGFWDYLNPKDEEQLLLQELRPLVSSPVLPWNNSAEMPIER